MAAKKASAQGRAQAKSVTKNAMKRASAKIASDAHEKNAGLTRRQSSTDVKSKEDSDSKVRQGWIPEASLSLRHASGQELTGRSLELLEAIAESGSLTAAARKLALSYKTAQRLVGSLNRSWESPLVEGLSGGAKGGGMALTGAGKDWLSLYQGLDAEQRRRMLSLSRVLSRPGRLASLEKRPTIKLSARNQWTCRIVAISEEKIRVPIRKGGCVRVEMATPNGDVLVARITKMSAQEMDLQEGMEVFAVIKANAVRSEVGEDANKTRSRDSNRWRAQWTLNDETREWAAQLAGGSVLISSVMEAGDGVRNSAPGWVSVNPDDVMIGIAW